jgi:antitoxin component of MazEF toxin-antitoxin module
MSVLVFQILTMSKKLLEESTIRQFMKLAQLEPLAGDFLEEKRGGKKRRPMREEEMEEGIHDDGTTPPPPVKGLGKKETMKATEKADAEARKKIEKTPGDVEMKKEEIALEEELNALFEEELNEMGDMYEGDMVYEEEDEDVEMEEEGDAEINITPDQARAIIAVADMLKDIMPDLEAPEMEDEEEMEMEPEMEPEMDMEMGAEEEEEGAEEEEEGAEEEEEGAEEELAEQIMKRVQARLREMKSK